MVLARADLLLTPTYQYTKESKYLWLHCENDQNIVKDNIWSSFSHFSFLPYSQNFNQECFFFCKDMFVLKQGKNTLPCYLNYITSNYMARWTLLCVIPLDGINQTLRGTMSPYNLVVKTIESIFLSAYAFVMVLQEIHQTRTHFPSSNYMSSPNT